MEGDDDKIILLSTSFQIFPILGTNCCCCNVIFFLCWQYTMFSFCCIVLSLIALSTAPPDEVYYVYVDCMAGLRAEIGWDAPNENNAPILNYIVQYSTTTPDKWFDFNNSYVAPNLRSIEVNLSPWATYMIRVLARNKIGVSDPNYPSGTTCTTEADTPDRNPENVIGEGSKPNNLVIFWTVFIFIFIYNSICNYRIVSIYSTPPLI